MLISAKLTNNRIEFNGSIDDPDLLEMLSALETESDLAKAIEDLILLGAKVYSATQASSTALVLESSVSKVSGELDKLETKHRDFISSLMEKIISTDEFDDQAKKVSVALKIAAIEKSIKENLVGEGNSESVLNLIKKSVEEYIKNRESSISKLLQLNEPSEGESESPLLQVFRQVESISTALGIKKEVDKVAVKTSTKGKKFESRVFELIQPICDDYNDVADDPGPQRINGSANNHEGDLTVDFTSLGKESGRLVIECKKFETTKSKNFLLGELDKGMDNRDADYGILITTEDSYRIEDHHPFWEAFDNRRAILVLQNDDDLIDPERLRFALLLAKSRVRAIKSKLDEATAILVDQKVRLIKSHFDRIRSLKGSMTKVRENLDDADSHIKYLVENAGVEIDELAELISS